MKTFTKGKYTLEHTIGEGMFGEEVDSFQVTYIDKTGHKYCIPTIPIIRVKVTGEVFEPLRPYTKEEYEEILDRTIKNLTE